MSEVASNDTQMTTLASEDITSPAIGYQKVDVCVPITVTPFAKTSTTTTKSCGKASVVAGSKPCSGTKNGACNFTISQSLCVAVPVEFGAVASVGETYVNCIDASSDDICAQCTPEEQVES